MAILEKGVVNQVNITTFDSNSKNLDFLPLYDPSLWEDHIEACALYFFRNIVALSSSGKSERLNAFVSSINSPQDYVKNIIKPRMLSSIEHDIVARHYCAWLDAANSNYPTLILEDDALLTSEKRFFQLIDLVSKHDDVGFFDCTDQYIPSRILGRNSFSDSNDILEYTLRTKPITRTLSAYILRPDSARILMEIDNAYSLPIDSFTSNIKSTFAEVNNITPINIRSCK